MEKIGLSRRVVARNKEPSVPASEEYCESVVSESNTEFEEKCSVCGMLSEDCFILDEENDSSTVCSDCYNEIYMEIYSCLCTIDSATFRELIRVCSPNYQIFNEVMESLISEFEEEEEICQTQIM